MTGSKDVVKQIRKATRRKFSADEKIRIVLEEKAAMARFSALAKLKTHNKVNTADS